MLATGIKSIKELLLDTVREILYFPFWWYGHGLKKTLFFCLGRIKHGWWALALRIILKNFFKTMYGQRGLDALILSVATHFVQLIWRLILFVLWIALWVIVFLAWLALPIFSLYKLFV